MFFQTIHRIEAPAFRLTSTAETFSDWEPFWGLNLMFDTAFIRNALHFAVFKRLLFRN
jgi:hypothetical protein